MGSQSLDLEARLVLPRQAVRLGARLGAAFKATAMSRSPAATARAWPAPSQLIVLFAAAQIVLWTLAPALTHRAPPIDVAEGYMWGREWVIATYKHPALPSWFLEGCRLLTGTTGWPAYLTSQLFIATTFALVFGLGCDMMGRERAAAGTLLLAGVTYYMWPTPEFNHNIASTPFWAGIVLTLWRAVERGGLLWWLLLGLFAAAALYAKLSAMFLLVPAAAWILWDDRARARLATQGPWLGLALFAVLLTPLVIWLTRHDLTPLRYAARRSLGLPVYQLPLFLLDTAANVAGIVVMLVFAKVLGPWRETRLRQRQRPATEGEDSLRAKQFLLVFTLGPLALAVLAALLSHAGLKTAWGSSMFNTAGLLAMVLTAERYSATALRRIAVSAAVLVAVVPLGYAVLVTFDAHRSSGASLRVNWPQSTIADRLGAVWARDTGQPLRIVAGSPWLAGLVGLSHKDTPSILTNGDLTLSPWISNSRIEREGLLAVWDAGNKIIPPALLPLIETARSGEERFSFGAGDGEHGVLIGYAVVPPKGSR
jgi:4-amino-4-deoxy-L-arabinose transferase-like glycosyltransferase